jgi:hypothetical protein
VLPRWALELPAAQRRLIVAHERQHAQARDPLLLAAAAAALVAVPWNAALWYVYGRLRHAVEVDCDARVLSGWRPGRRDAPAHGWPDAHAADGDAVHAYGSLLLDVGERMIAGAAPVTGLAGPTSHLHRRLTLMTARAPRFAHIRLAAAVTASAACTVLAAQTPAPAAGVRPGPARGEPRDAAVSTAASDTAPPETAAFIPDTTIRRAVAERFAEALPGGLGHRPLLWILADARDRVLATATGREGLSRNRFGQEGLDWDAARRTFPGRVPPAMTRADRAQWSAVPAGADSVEVIWIRVARATNAATLPASRSEPAGVTPERGRAVVHITAVGLDSIPDARAVRVLVYAARRARVGVGTDAPAPLTDTLRLDRLPAITADVTDADVHLELVSPGRMRIDGEVTGGAATRIAATGRHLVLLKGGVGVSGGARTP